MVWKTMALMPSISHLKKHLLSNLTSIPTIWFFNTATSRQEDQYRSKPHEEEVIQQEHKNLLEEGRIKCYFMCL